MGKQSSESNGMPVEFGKKLAKSLLIGSLAGLGIALFTAYFFEDLIDRIENLTYYMRYSWEYDELPKKNTQARAGEQSGICIIDIDERSMHKLGQYWNWNRGYHAKMLNALKEKYPAAVVFDICFFNKEDQNEARHLNNLLDQAQQKNSDISIDRDLQSALVHSIDYDKRFIQATQDAGEVYMAIQMGNKEDYPEYALSQIQQRMTMEWHQSLNPSSALEFPPDIRKKVYYTKPVIDGIFPELAGAATAIGHINITPNSDGVIREIPLLFGFGSYQPVYMPIALRTVVSLFGTPNDEVTFVPEKYIDIGKPFKIFRDSTGVFNCSYPSVSIEQIEAIIEKKDEIMGLETGEAIDMSSFAEIGIDSGGKQFLRMHCGDFTTEVCLPLCTADMDKILSMEEGETVEVSSEVSISRDSDIDWIVTAPYGYEEWWMSRLDLVTIGRIHPESFDVLDTGESRLLFSSLQIKRSENELHSTIPVIRGKVLDDLLRTPWRTIESIKPGMRMDFGTPVRIPLTPENRHIATFFGPKATTFPLYSYYDIMENRVHGSLEGKIFLVGSTVQGMFDIVHVPHDDVYPGVEVHASLMNSFLTNTFIRRLSVWQDFLILVLVGVVIGVIAFMLKPLLGAILTLVSVFIYFLIAMTVFGSDHIWIEIARPILTIILTYTLVMVYRYITEEKDRKFLQNTFKTYLSPELIDIMYKQKQPPMLGGDEGIRTAFFTDIQSFSTFSEKLGSPTRLVELLNEYLTGMTDTLLENYGTLDKYEGDAIIAFFGAPMPMDDHAYRACIAGLGMQKKLGDLRTKWASEAGKWPEIVHAMQMRIGINSGRITTGNMGSAQRMNYTMMGDAVNLAARLEGAAKQYGIYTMISQATYDLVKDRFEVRQLDKITVVGKSEPVIVYELICEKGQMSPEISTLVGTYQEGLNLFYSQKWDDAISALTEAEKLEPYREVAPKGMSPSRKIIEYCEMYKQNPPGEGWDGVMRLTTK
jgi:adenylate cyclase